MTERNRACRAKAEARAAPTLEDMLREIEKIEIWNAERGLKIRGLPAAWDDVGWEFPSEPPRAPMTLRLSPEVRDWYEGFGPEHGGRINVVLRLYMLGVISGEIETPERFDWRGNRIEG